MISENMLSKHIVFFHAHNKHNFYYYKTKQFMLALLYFKEKYLSYLSNAHFTADFSDQNHNSVIF
jgi:hypothetical protein